MMFGLPKETEVFHRISKIDIYRKFDFTAAQKTAFDEDIAKLGIIHEISENTLHLTGLDDNAFFILEIQLKKKDYDSKNIERLFKLIDRNLLLALVYESEVRFAVFKTVLHQSAWQNVEAAKLSLNGYDYATMWENIIRSVIGITEQSGENLAAQIEAKIENEKLQKQIAVLEAKMRKEKQPNKKFALFEEIQKLKCGLK